MTYTPFTDRVMKAREQSTLPDEAKPATTSEWECFSDQSYFDMWCVRPVGSRTFGEGFHVPSEGEARALADTLTTQAAEIERLQMKATLTAAYLSTALEREAKLREALGHAADRLELTSYAKDGTDGEAHWRQAFQKWASDARLAATAPEQSTQPAMQPQASERERIVAWLRKVAKARDDRADPEWAAALSEAAEFIERGEHEA